MKKHRKIDALLEKVLEHVKGFILAAFVTVAILSLLVGYRYNRYTEDDPQFCATCHLMKDAFLEWQKGKHRDVVCQQCHQLSILEKNRLLIAYVVKGTQPLAQTHGREKPWLACRGCHTESIEQGSVTTTESYGHARHVFIQKLKCQVCHKRTFHDFQASETACQNCHKDKGVHGVGMDTSSCLSCHAFTGKKTPMIPNNRCTRCHSHVPKTGPMSGLFCHECHKPHSTVEPAAATCVNKCHRDKTSSGQHALHYRKGIDCMYCHKPHTWLLGKNGTRSLCGKCHRPEDPFLFSD